eukprot:GHVU01005591.1.p1 GENE.GHVU01005591.1~~GHVU01005591.1.p1  ORF type:complete len:317 (-),score=48.53 GHVU01005591.1:118-1068(-)
MCTISCTLVLGCWLPSPFTPGSSVECCAYPSGVCAISVAVFNAISEGASKLELCAFVGHNYQEHTSPCGGCLQVLSEMGDCPLYLGLAKPDGKLALTIRTSSVSARLPGQPITGRVGPPASRTGVASAAAVPSDAEATKYVCGGLHAEKQPSGEGQRGEENKEEEEAKTTTAAPTSDDQRLTDEEVSLCKAAIAAARLAHAPDSNFPVGAAVLSTGGSVYSGCNVEIAVNPLGICAERVAIVKAVGAGARKMRGLAVTTPKGKGFASPCGACRQLIMEFGDYPVLRIDLDRETGNFAVKKMSTYELVPDGFHPEQL